MWWLEIEVSLVMLLASSSTSDLPTPFYRPLKQFVSQVMLAQVTLLNLCRVALLFTSTGV